MRLFTLGQIMTLTAERGPVEGKPRWANLAGAKVQPESPELANDLAGGGVYACFWRDQLIYIGEFVNTEGDPFGGHVFSRIEKHAAGFLQRDRRLFFNQGPFQRIVQMKGPIACDLRDCDPDLMTRGSGVCSSERKVRFAQEDWEFIESASPIEIMDLFTVGYRRITPPNDIDLPSADWIKYQWVVPIERSLIRRLNPICNSHFRSPGPDGPRLSFEETRAIFEEAFAAAEYMPEQ